MRAGPPSALTAVGGLIGAVPAVVLSVALPPERNALIVFTHELKRKSRIVSKRW